MCVSFYEVMDLVYQYIDVVIKRAHTNTNTHTNALAHKHINAPTQTQIQTHMYVNTSSQHMFNTHAHKYYMHKHMYFNMCFTLSYYINYIHSYSMESNLGWVAKAFAVSN